MGGSRAIGSLEKQVCIWLYNTCLTHVIASDVIPRYMQNIVQICLGKTLQIWYAD